MRVGRLFVSLLALALASLALVSPSLAQDMPTIRHRVKPGDSLALLAAEYYGDRRHAVFILVANGLTHPRALRPREVLKIPMNRKITAKAGDTLETIAEQHLGDARRAPFLAEFNNLAKSSSVAVGQVIEVPFHVTHRAASDEKVTDIAAAYFGDKRKAKLLREYNFLKKDTVSKGDSIIIPINHVRVQASKLPPPDADSTARVAKRAEMQKKAKELLPTVRSAWNEGDYGAVKRALTPLSTEYLDVELAVEVGVLLGAAYVAFGDADSALVTFRKVLARRSQHTLSAYRYSPKVRNVWTRAGGTVSD